MTAHRIRVSANIAYDNLLPHYQGYVKDVTAPDLTAGTQDFLQAR